MVDELQQEPYSSCCQHCRGSAWTYYRYEQHDVSPFKKTKNKKKTGLVTEVHLWDGLTFCLMGICSQCVLKTKSNIFFSKSDETFQPHFILFLQPMEVNRWGHCFSPIAVSVRRQFQRKRKEEKNKCEKLLA